MTGPTRPEQMQRTAVLDPWARPESREQAAFRGHVQHVAFDEQSRAWAWWLPDEAQPPRTLHAYDDGMWPIVGDVYVQSVTDTLLALEPPASLRLVKTTFHVYARPFEVPS